MKELVVTFDHFVGRNCKASAVLAHTCERAKQKGRERRADNDKECRVSMDEFHRVLPFSPTTRLRRAVPRVPEGYMTRGMV